MLYISKYHFYENECYVVTDSTNGKEYVMKKPTIKRYLHSGTRVYGVEGSDFYVYQPEETITTRQVKASTMLGINIKVYKSEIVEVRFKYLPKTVSHIRLSDFGTSLNRFALTPVRVADKVYAVFILDNKIDFDAEAFSHGIYLTIRDLGIMLDVRELSDKAVEPLYENLAEHADLGASADENLIDNPERMARLTAKHFNS